MCPHELQHAGLLLSSLSLSLLKLMSIESVVPSNHLILCCCLLSCPQFLPASGSFPMNWPFASGGQSIGVSASASLLPVNWLFASGGQSSGALTSASVFPINIQGWFRFGVAGLISLLSKELSRVFSSTTIQKHQFFSTQPSLRSKTHIHA